jgi:hypothetical protein
MAVQAALEGERVFEGGDDALRVEGHGVEQKGGSEVFFHEVGMEDYQRFG